MSERIRGGYDDALYKSTFTLLYFTLLHTILKIFQVVGQLEIGDSDVILIFFIYGS